ncbi:hypothetical protein NP233_g2238 [Leucocoprinus birnbaumii]|uniref:MATE efflux family protein n=1 Tax=Leucocoprinus birnbaumii TaxID=56174 RepID=A0AAD5YZ70_9AGAR|nr:hypothetical protein NP233_g2238 [Leucocoprinus birnbaumii]
MGSSSVRHEQPSSLYSHEDDAGSDAHKITTVSETTPLLPDIRVGAGAGCDDKALTQIIKEEIPLLGRYALPVFGSQLLEYTLRVASIVFIGHLSTNALAGASLGFMTASVTGNSIIQGLTSALDTLLPSAWTSSRPNLIGLWSQRMFVVSMASSIPTLFIWFNAEPLFLALKQDPEVAHLASVYLRWSSLGLPAFAFNNISRRYFQSQNLFSVPTHIIIAVSPINLLLNYLFVWGPAPVRLGFIGAPLATSISFNLISILSIIYGIYFVPRTAWHPFSMKMFNGLGILVKLGLSGIGQVAADYWAWEGVALAASLLGPVALASQSILVSSASTIYQAPYSLALATAVRIGNLLGEQKARRAYAAAITGMIWSLVVAAFTSTLFMVFRQSWAYIFNDDPKVVSMVAGIIPLCALFQAFDGITAVTGGILRAQGRQFTGAVLISIAYYVIGIPTGLSLAFKSKMDLLGIWIGLTMALVLCAIVGAWLSLRTDWEHEVERVQERLSMEKDRDRVLGASLEGGEHERGEIWLYD